MSPHALLLVDDEPEILEALRRTLRTEGYQLFATERPADALRIVDAERVNLILSDIDMPGMSGLELVSRVRRTHPRIIRILLSGVASLESALRAINEGEVHRYLTKPWETPELRTTIREALERFDDSPVDPLAGVEPLSPRMRDTLDALMTGASEKEIAARLGVSPHTVHQYVKALYRRFEVTSRPELMATIHGRRALERR
jgi:DNA-binding NarL/FixJ family response regulator